MPDETASDAPRHLVFRVGSALYGLPLEAVQEVVVPRPPFVRVPRAPDAVRGAMNLRGRVVAVVHLAKMLGIQADATSAVEHVIMLERGRRGLGFSVGAVLGVEALVEHSAAVTGAVDGLVRDTATSEQHRLPVSLLDPDLLEARGSALFAPL